RIGPTARQRSAEPYELGIAQRVDDEQPIVRVDRDAGIKLLILDEARAGTRNALHDQVEAARIADHPVVVDGHAQILSAPGPARAPIGARVAPFATRTTTAARRPCRK